MAKAKVSKPEQAVTVREDSSVTVSQPSFLMGDVAVEKTTVPRLNLLQALSEGVQVMGQPVGTFANSITGTNYGEKITLAPVKISQGALYIVNGEGLKCRSSDGVINQQGIECRKCPFKVYHADWTNGTPQCQETVDILALDAVSKDPFVVTFRSTSAKVGKKIASALNYSKTFQTLTLTSSREKNAKGTFFTPKIESFQPATEDQYKAALEWRTKLQKNHYTVDDNTD